MSNTTKKKPPTETNKCLKTISPFRTDQGAVVFTFVKLRSFSKRKG